MSVTLHDVAREAGVSTATVSRVMSNSAYPVNVRTRQRVLSAAAKLDYRPNLLARGLRTEQTYTIGIILDGISRMDFTPHIVRGIMDVLHREGFHALLLNADFDPDKELAAVRELTGRSVDGLILVESLLSSPDELGVRDTPYVLVHRLIDTHYPYSVVPAEVEGGFLATQHLTGLGHRRIGYIHGPDIYFATHDRHKGYRLALAEAGIDYDERLVMWGDWEVASGYKAGQEFLRLPELPSAVFAANDLMALGAIYAFQDAGLTIPKDVAIVGYDDRPISFYFRPSITTVTIPMMAMGAKAAELMIDLLKGQADASEEFRIAGELIVRESSGGEPPQSFSSDTFDNVKKRRKQLEDRVTRLRAKESKFEEESQNS